MPRKLHIPPVFLAIATGLLTAALHRTVASEPSFFMAAFFATSMTLGMLRTPGYTTRKTILFFCIPLYVLLLVFTWLEKSPAQTALAFVLMLAMAALQWIFASIHPTITPPEASKQGDDDDHDAHHQSDDNDTPPRSLGKSSAPS